MPSGSSMGSVGRRSVLAPLCATWRIAADGRSIGCREGVDIADASVIVQLYASGVAVKGRYTTPTALYADRRCLEFLRHAKLNDQQRSLVMALRDDRVRLLGSRAYDATGPHSLGAVLTEMGCPCGKGRQTVAHASSASECLSETPRRVKYSRWERADCWVASDEMRRA